MSKRVSFIVSAIFVLSLLLSACSTATEAPVATVAPATGASTPALSITGNIGSPIGWSEDEIKSMDTLDVQYTNKDGVTKTYTGVLLSDLLTLASPKTDATTITFVADDGFTAEVALADVMACADCIVAIRSDGGFQTVLPTFEGKLQVKGVVEIQVK